MPIRIPALHGGLLFLKTETPNSDRPGAVCPQVCGTASLSPMVSPSVKWKMTRLVGVGADTGGTILPMLPALTPPLPNGLSGDWGRGGWAVERPLHWLCPLPRTHGPLTHPLGPLVKGLPCLPPACSAQFSLLFHVDLVCLQPPLESACCPPQGQGALS